MKEYIPIYLKDYDKCPRCNNNLNTKKILLLSYLNECKKCSNMSMYGENQLNNHYGYSDRNELLYESCSCKTEYIYKYITKCDNCIKCDECNDELSNDDFVNIINEKTHHLCKKCYNKKNYPNTLSQL